MEEKTFYQQLIFIAIPVALQNLIVSLLNTLDTMMISSIGDAAIAGVGLANQVFFFFIMICFGITTGSSVLVSQFWGKRDRPSVQKVHGIAMVISVTVAVIFTLLALLFPQQILARMISDQSVVTAGAAYLRVASLSYIVTSLSYVYASTLRSTGNPRTPLVASILSFFANAFFNYVFIFGFFGIPAFGVVGAAMGTIIARVIELATILFVVRTYDGPLHCKLKEMMSFDKLFLQRFLTTALPVIINETFWSAGQVMYSIAYAIIGREATAAVQVCVAIQNIAFVIVRGLGNACTIMVGNKIGQGQIEEVKSYASRFLKLGLGSGVVIALIMGLTPQWSLRLFGSLSTTVQGLAVTLLQVMAVIFVIKTLTSIIVVGILRGGGDTRFSMFLEMGTSWLIGVPLAFIGAALLKWPVYGVIALVGIEEVVKVLIGLLRVRTGKWVHNVTD
ncbi:MATE family efflux transporter [Eremococcus coleocola]|uniref:Probable multidrug resistance protein NorM n=1 Tax=Eremococcus coleocola ACS-139-V-Col8 TaxID=908337 RepID=E4KRD8_9LACT|nr:MATE family efflux transporter [Eremococcus coleocola]EFR30535.1 MATE efflux family protein [Eremococcus coleocola ACS-139-V-Col8]